MRNLILVLITICSFQFVNSQSLDQATINKIKVKRISAEKLYEQGEYYDALKKIEEIEALSKGLKFTEIQNLKVKVYLGWESYSSAKQELDILYGMNPSEEIINDIASYEPKIDDGIAEEKAKKEKARLAEIERKEEVRLAQIEEEEKREKIKKAISNFEFKPCNKCQGLGVEDSEVSKKCTAYYSGPNRGGGNKRYYFGCREGKCKTKKKGESWEYFTCTSCNGSGKVKYMSTIACSQCSGGLYNLSYIGNEYFSKEQINDIITTNYLDIIAKIPIEEIKKIFNNLNFKLINEEIKKFNSEWDLKYQRKMLRTGCFSKDCTNGLGVTMWNGDIYYGYLLNKKRHGVGITITKNGDKWAGVWRIDELNGFGTYTKTNGEEKVGIFKNGVLIEIKN